MALMVERVVDGSVHAEETLGGCCRLEPLHLALSPSHDFVGVLGPALRLGPHPAGGKDSPVPVAKARPFLEATKEAAEGGLKEGG